jgi:septum formation protein
MVLSVLFRSFFMEPIILASSSPQRKTLLEGLGIPFVVIPSQVNEEACTEVDPAKRAVLLAREKAQEVAGRHRGRWVIGCDTLVVAPDGTLLEKPVDEADARRMLMMQSGGASTVHSGLTVITPAGITLEGLSSSEVRFRTLSEKDIAWWMSTKLWQNRSGGFQIDGQGQLMIENIRGDWTSIVGLPVYLLGELLRAAEHPFMN